MNLQQIGRKISALRKERDMTQNELAEKAGVSYQAVSSWERGLTMPDIAKLPGISQILGVSVDQLLDNSSEVELVKNVLNNNTTVYVHEKELHVDEVAEVAPILRPSQVSDLMQHVDVEEIDLSELAGIAPFVSQEIIDGLALKAVNVGSLHDLHGIAPFVSQEIIDDLALKAIKAGSLHELRDIAPFVSQEVIDALALKAVQRVKNTN